MMRIVPKSTSPHLQARVLSNCTPHKWKFSRSCPYCLGYMSTFYIGPYFASVQLLPDLDIWIYLTNGYSNHSLYQYPYLMVEITYQSGDAAGLGGRGSALQHTPRWIKKVHFYGISGSMNVTM